MDAVVIRIGSRVRVRDVEGEEQYSVVAADEVEHAAHRISAESPLGRALLGHRVGETVHYRAPMGELAVTVVGVE